MGIRIHKVLGYGLTDVVCDEEGYRIEDPRINPESLFLSGEFWNTSLDDYIAWLAERPSEDSRLNMDLAILREKEKDRTGKRYDFQGTFIHDGEYGMSSVVLLTPITTSDWRRYDDIIDYTEETYMREGEQIQDRVFELPHGIYPWSAIYMDTRTGERMERDREMLWRRRYFHDDITDDDRDEIARVIGFKDFAEANSILAPVVPEEIQDLVEYGELFIDPMGWTQLRPLHYVYWA